MRSMLDIGFVGWRDDKNPDSTRNLTLEASVKKAKQFNKLWDDLNGTSAR